MNRGQGKTIVCPHVAAALSVIAVLVAGCGAGHTPPSEQSTVNTTPSPGAFKEISGQFPQPATLTDSGAADAPVGGCVQVSGTPTRAVLNVAACTSPHATYRVIQRVRTPEQCVTDKDHPVYYHDENAQWTACLDLNWDSTYCINLGQVVSKVACDDPNAHNKIKPSHLLTDTTTVEGCPQGGYAHPTRRFTICTEPR